VLYKYDGSDPENVLDRSTGKFILPGDRSKSDDNLDANSEQSKNPSKHYYEDSNEEAHQLFS